MHEPLSDPRWSSLSPWLYDHNHRMGSRPSAGKQSQHLAQGCIAELGHLYPEALRS